MDIHYELIKSWADREGNINSLSEIKNWIMERNAKLKVNIEQIYFSYTGFWHYDNNDGYIRNDNNSFFQLAGYQEIDEDKIVLEQPIIIQDEIGYLGIICKMIDGRLNFLMQAKIEPGNVNVIQISPTLQATKSNFDRKHGGKSPKYLEYFIDSGKYYIIADQIQSEQSSRFYKKRNRNIIILINEDIPLYDSHKWMTLGQIKELMKYNNLVNMDTRTVLSCISFKLPMDKEQIKEVQKIIHDGSLYQSLFNVPDSCMIRKAFNLINDYKMFNNNKYRLLPLRSLKGWDMNEREIVCKTPSDFKVIYCRIEIEEREVNYWEQPLVQALGQAVFGLFTCVDNGVRKYLVRIKKEIGCFDSAELGPTIQMEPTNPKNSLNMTETLFLNMLQTKKGIITNAILSEEGGRFYHEENQNVIIQIEKNQLSNLSGDYLWMDYATISEMIQYNNWVNIQLRNLISLIDIQ